MFVSGNPTYPITFFFSEKNYAYRLKLSKRVTNQLYFCRSTYYTIHIATICTSLVTKQGGTRSLTPHNSLVQMK